MKIPKALLLGVAAGAAVVILKRQRPIDLRGKVVLITGGSHGLGVAMARQFADEGARLALCARDLAELRTAQRDLESRGAEVFVMACDVADRARVEALIEAVVEHYGHLDILVNNAGVIQVGPVDTMRIEDFEFAMDVMFWGMVYATFAALPHLRRAAGARIVNITSVGGKVSVPHLLPYSCAKFAAVAFSEGLTSELRRDGVRVVTIVPNLMRTGSYANAHFQGDSESEAAWFAASSSLPGIAISAEKAASEIVCATKKGTAEKFLGAPAGLLSRFHGLFPGATGEILSLVNRILPNAAERHPRRGSQIPMLRTPLLRALTALGRKAAERLLQPA